MTAVVITTYSAPPATLERCLRAVVAGGDADRIVVVDNGASAEIPLDLAGRVELIRTGHNGGFGSAANIGIRDAIAHGEAAVALLNDDVVVERGWLGPLLDELRTHPSVGAVQPKLLIAGSEPPLVNSVGVVLDRFGAGSDVGYGQPDGPAFAGATTIAMFTGGAVLLAAAFFDELGGFDERMFMYYEDVDLALRGAEHGWEYRCCPASRVWHEGGASSAELGDGLRFYVERNRLWCLARFGSADRVRAGLWLSVRRLRHAPRRIHARALLAGIVGAPRRRRERTAGTRRRR